MDFDGIALRGKVRQRNANVLSFHLYLNLKKPSTQNRIIIRKVIILSLSSSISFKYKKIASVPSNNLKLSGTGSYAIIIPNINTAKNKIAGLLTFI